MIEMELYDDVSRLNPISRKKTLDAVLEEEEQEQQARAAKASSGGWLGKLFKVKR